ncbi:MAG TPA: hypothetical protein VFK59_00690 [Actinomycetota bacterium]|nr:hypothetical protein [Actinomycetota bacterium]
MRAHRRRDAWLALVPGGYSAALDVPTRFGVVPMVLLGSAGAFVLGSVDWPGMFLRLERWMMVDGDEADLVTHRLLRQALEIKHVLARGDADLHVEPILVATDGALVACRGELEPWGVRFDHLAVLAPVDVPAFIEARPARHAARQVAAARSLLEGGFTGIARAAGA